MYKFCHQSKSYLFFCFVFVFLTIMQQSHNYYLIFYSGVSDHSRGTDNIRGATELVFAIFFIR